MEIENQIQNINKKKINFDNFRIKNREKINQKNDCEICGGSFSYFNKSTHLNSIKCQKVKTLRGL
jgi:hypothetical protein